jgi:hypothetical protein
MISHPGGISGFGSYAIRIPSHHIFVVALTNNSSGYSAVVSAARQIALKLAGKVLAKPATRSLSRAQLSEYAGVYEKRHSMMQILSNSKRDKVYRYLTVQDSLLFSQWGGGRKSTLLNVGEDRFVFKGTDSYIRFRRDNNGKINALEGYYDPFAWGPVRSERRTDLPLPKEKVAISLDGKILKSYAGKYNLGIDNSRRIRVDGLHVYADGIGEIFPESQTRFFSKVSGATIEFIMNSKGAVTSSLWTSLGTYEGKKIE